MKLFSIIVLPLALATLLVAQFGAGTILGTVTDPTHAVVAGATVTVKNEETGETRTFVTDSSGNYLFTALQVGKYSIAVTAPSFKKALIPDIELRVNTQTRADVVMQLGTLSETVQVAATAPLLQTDTATLGTAIDNRTVLELPLNARNFFDLMALTPGALKTAGGSSVMDGRAIEIGGIRNTSTNAMLDGVDFSVANINNPAIALSLDAIEEFKVQVNFMDASYGHGAAGLDMVTRRGTNQFHGVAYDFVRNRSFQAGQFFRPPNGAPRFSYNQFGASFGGPLRRDKTFFFGNYEGRRRRTGVILQSLVPTPQMLAGDFSATGKTIRDPFNNNQPIAGNIIPKSRWDPVAAQLIQYFPDANFIGQRAGVNFISTPSDKERRDQFTGRVDHRLSAKGTLFGRYSFADDSLGNAAYRIGLGLIRPDRTQHIAAGYTHLFSSNVISDTRLGFTKAFLARQSDGDRYTTNFAAQLGLKNLAASPGDYTLPQINMTGYGAGFAPDAPGFVGYGSHIVQNNIYYRASEAITWVKNRHTLKMGDDWSRLMVGYDQGSNQNGIFSFNGNYSGDSFGDFLLGVPSSANGGLGSLGNFGGVAKYSFGTQFQAYMQDDWKVTDRLTLNLGVRYEFFLPWRGRLANFDLATRRQLLAGRADYFAPGIGLVQGSGAALLPERPIQSDKNNLAPRVGVAYRVGSRTTIRSGAGVFYALNTGGTVLVPMTSTAPYFIQASLNSSATRPELFLSQLFPSPSQTSASVNSTVDLNKRDGYIYQYNFNVQHEIRRGMLIETGYIGNTAQKQIGTLFVNQPRLPSNPASPEPVTARQPYPGLSSTFSRVANYQWSNYNAWYAKVEQRLSAGLSYIVAYTRSKFIDSGGAGQNMYDRRPERALADTDVRDNFIASYVWDLPVGKGRPVNIANPVLNAVLGQWELSGITNFRSGMPINITTSGDLANVITGGQRANATGVKPGKVDPRSNGLIGFIREAYSTPARGTFGNLGRNVQGGFGINNWDLGVNKNFAISRLGEGSRLQIRAEFFNVFNHTQFRGIGATQTVPTTFGIVNSTYDPRILQLAGKLYF
jgi:hypothetical protein